MTNARTAKSAREKAAELRAEAAKQEARRRSIVITGVVVLVVVILVGAFVLIQTNRRNTETSGSATPANLGANNSIVVGKSSAPVTLVAYEDFQCPVCRQFEQENSAQIKQWVSAGTLKVEYRPIAFLDRSSTTEYSTRALNAAAAVVDSDPGAFSAFHDELFANQPEEGSAGLPDSQLISMAVTAGAPKAAITTAVNDQTYQGWTAKVTEDSSKAGVTGTPTLIVNGRTLANYDAATVKQAVEAAAK